MIGESKQLSGEVAMKVLSYQLSAKFDRFYKEQKDLLGLDDIVFIPMSEHPGMALHSGDYGTTHLSEDGKVLEVYLNPDLINLHSPDELDYVAEIIAVHEILHQWTKTQGYPEILADQRISNDFLNLFHHRVITRVMDGLGYDYSIPDRFVAEEFIDKNTALLLAEGFPEYEPDSVTFWVFTIKYAEYYFKFPPDSYQEARQLISDTNMPLLLRSDQCVAAIEDSKCWESPGQMFVAMQRVRDILQLPTGFLDIMNPDTGEWC